MELDECWVIACRYRVVVFDTLFDGQRLEETSCYCRCPLILAHGGYSKKTDHPHPPCDSSTPQWKSIQTSPPVTASQRPHLIQQPDPQSHVYLHLLLQLSCQPILHNNICRILAPHVSAHINHTHAEGERTQAKKNTYRTQPIPSTRQLLQHPSIPLPLRLTRRHKIPHHNPTNLIPILTRTHCQVL
jgi:hypothetical protein